MKQLLGVLLIVAGVALGLYVGLWVCFIGGIVDVVDAVKATPVEAMNLAWGIVKIVFAGAAGALSAYALIFPGYFMAASR